MSEARVWVSSYPPGVPANIDDNAYQNLVQFFVETLDQHASKIAFESMGKGLSYTDLQKQSNYFAAYLQSRGLVAGDKIALMMPNCLQYPIAIIGALKAGLIVVNTNPLYTPREMQYQFSDSDVKAIVILENFAHNLEQILGHTKISIVITTSLGELLGPVKGTIVNLVVRHVKKMVPKYNIANTVCFKEALKGGQGFTVKPLDSKPDDVIIHQYTGGTTGVSKGAMLTNRNMIANMLQMKTWMETTLSDGNEVALSPLPMYHIFAFTVNCLALTALGAKTVLVTNAKDISSVIKEFEKNKITVFSGLNTLFNAMLNHPDFAGKDFSGLKVTVAGGMALQKAVAERWEGVTGCRISEGYGMTESSPVLTVNILGKNARLGYIGLPVSSTDIKIVDDNGVEVPLGTAGELIAKGPQIMKGYYNKDEETAKTVKDGWLYTGDIAIMEPDGYFKIVDRKKDMILVSGFNVYPNEIEDVLVTHPKILEAAAIGVQDDKSGESVKVFIVKRDPSLTEDEVYAFSRENLTGYKVPKAVEFRTELPKTNVGKILRRELR
ncbi:MAG: AMP-binding protein [Saprospiraceae bacterium]|nr:AMP-binding protein [Saprospiraceae bacterium]MBK9688469.1 AMP-binding protein [Saprospiraceae bacterium]MBL0084354.1 AMP-binding protein [Saprospiraceae bacterium]